MSQSKEWKQLTIAEILALKGKKLIRAKLN